MRRLAVLVVLLAGCAKSSQIVVGVITNLQVPSTLKTAQLEAYRDGVQVGSELFSPIATQPRQPYALPGSFDFYSPRGGTPVVQLVLTGYGADPGTPLLQRTAVVQYVAEDARFFRMALVQACIGTLCPDGTCVEGTCQQQSFDSARMPHYHSGMESTVECDSGSSFIDTTTCGSGTDGVCSALPVSGSCGAGETCIEGTCYAM